MNTEVLVHVKAPSKFVDDKRYAAVAQSILDFEPAVLVRCTDEDAGGDPTEHVLEYDAAPDPKLEAPATNLRRAQRATATFSREERPLISAAFSNVVNVLSKSYGVTKRIPSRRQLRSQSKLRNPPYRSPLRDRSVEKVFENGAHPESISETPVVQNKTIASILVPNTSVVKRKHAKSFSSDSCPNTSFVANSQLTASSHIYMKSRSHRSAPTSQTTVPSGCQKDKNQGANPHKRYAVSAKENVDLESTMFETTGRPSQSLSSILRPIHQTSNELAKTSMPESGGSSNHSADNVNTITRHDSPVLESDESTLTMSPRSTRGAILQYSLSDSVKTVSNPSPIDLTTPEATVAAVTISGHRPKVSSPCLTQLTTRMPGSVSSGVSFAASRFLEIQALPLIIDPPQVKVPRPSIPSYDSPILQATAEGLSLPRCFRPGSMTRGVADRERGYWNIPMIIITVEEAIAQGRQSSTKLDSDERRSDSPLFKRDSLTEPEFVTVWNELSRYVSSGRAGWGVRIVRRRFCLADIDTTNYSRAQLYLQVYCYGEAIPYIYAMLLVCTRMHVLCKPLTWISALDEQAIVTMTGGGSGNGIAMNWARYLDRQGRGFWRC